MKKSLIFTLCFIFAVTSTNSYMDYEVTPLEHYLEDIESK